MSALSGSSSALLQSMVALQCAQIVSLPWNGFLGSDRVSYVAAKPVGFGFLQLGQVTKIISLCMAHTHTIGRCRLGSKQTYDYICRDAVLRPNVADFSNVAAPISSPLHHPVPVRACAEPRVYT